MKGLRRRLTLAWAGPAAGATQPVCGVGPRKSTPCGERGLGSEEGDGLTRCAGRLETACDPNSSVGEKRAELAPCVQGLGDALHVHACSGTPEPSHQPDAISSRAASFAAFLWMKHREVP